MKLLLDAHVPIAVAGAIRKRLTGLDVQHLAQWKGGELLEATDEDILYRCAEEGRVLVTYDLATIPGLLAQGADTGQDHGGVIFVDEHTIPPAKVGALGRAISDLLDELGDTDTINLVRFLQRPHARNKSHEK